jgi:hypothetical protein
MEDQLLDIIYVSCPAEDKPDNLAINHRRNTQLAVLDWCAPMAEPGLVFARIKRAPNIICLMQNKMIWFEMQQPKQILFFSASAKSPFIH